MDSQTNTSPRKTPRAAAAGHAGEEYVMAIQVEQFVQGFHRSFGHAPQVSPI
jgi:hypothetical protein